MANDNKKISVFLGHPAHFHLYKYVVDGLIKKQYNVSYLIKKLH